MDPERGAGRQRAAASARQRLAATTSDADERGGSDPSVRTRRFVRAAETPADPVEALLGLIGDGLATVGRDRLVEVAPGRWWLADRRDRDAAAVPLSDRVEWAVYSLLSTAGPLSETAFLQRIAGIFSGQDLPDEALVRACLQSYRSRASTADRIVTGDDLLGRAQDHSEVIAMLAEIGPPPRPVRLDRPARAGPPDRTRPAGGLARRARAAGSADPHQPGGRRRRATSTASGTSGAGWPSCSRSSGPRCSASRSSVATPGSRRTTGSSGSSSSRRSGPSSSATSWSGRRCSAKRSERDNWHVLKWNHLQAFLAREEMSLEALEPYLGLDPVVERSGEQLGLFGEYARPSHDPPSPRRTKRDPVRPTRLAGRPACRSLLGVDPRAEPDHGHRLRRRALRRPAGRPEPRRPGEGAGRDGRDEGRGGGDPAPTGCLSRTGSPGTC